MWFFDSECYCYWSRICRIVFCWLIWWWVPFDYCYLGLLCWLVWCLGWFWWWCYRLYWGSVWFGWCLFLCGWWVLDHSRGFFLFVMFDQSWCFRCLWLFLESYCYLDLGGFCVELSLIMWGCRCFWFWGYRFILWVFFCWWFLYCLGRS